MDSGAELPSIWSNVVNCPTGATAACVVGSAPPSVHATTSADANSNRGALTTLSSRSCGQHRYARRTKDALRLPGWAWMRTETRAHRDLPDFVTVVHCQSVAGVPGAVESPVASLLPIPNESLPTHERSQGITPGIVHLWRCRESNPGPFRSEPSFYVRSRAIAPQPPRFVRHCAVAAYSLLGVPYAPVTGAFGESPS